MPRPRFLFALCALAAGVAVAGFGPAWADEVVVNFGQTTPSNFSTCTHASGDDGYVCSSGAQWAAPPLAGETLTATGYTDQFTTQANITWKNQNVPGVTPTNTVDEAGLGQNNAGPGHACDDNAGVGSECEVGPNRGLIVTSNNLAITDASIGSVQKNAEVFELWAWTINTGLTAANGIDLGTFSSNGSTGANPSTACPSYDGIGLCTFAFDPAKDYLAIGIYELAGIGGAQSDSLITAVSVVPAPAIGQGLPAALAVGGLLFGARLWGRKNTRNLAA